jgi:putative tryptophan/tyrosine transport system substrate-binding protein
VNRRGVLAAAVGAPIALALGGNARAQAKTARVGYLSPTDPQTAPGNLNALREGLRERGYVEGRNLTIELAWSAGTSGLKPELVADLIRRKVDVIVVWGTPASLVAKQATSTVPIVMVSVADPVGSGLVPSLAHPGGNITGLSTFSSDLSAKQAELLAQILPEISMLAVLRNAGNASSTLQVREVEAAIRALGLKHRLFEIRSTSEFESAFAAMTKARATALVVLTDQLFISYAPRVADLAIKHRLPAAFGRRENVDAGGLISYGASLTDSFRQAGDYVSKILKGAKPGDLPVERATKFELVINRKTARILGITIPQNLLLRADQVIG